jgi:redox-sensitive bicupin YhaK (pirin superfamily)
MKAAQPLKIRGRQQRGHTRLSWLDSYHSFSFGDYYDPAHMGFSDLRVINDDRVAPGGGFGTHPHRDMEIITVVLEGELEHKDSMGNGSVIRPGDVQRMSAGSGITHSEFNPSAEHATRLLQIWIMPQSKGITPSYEQKAFSPEEKQGKFRLLASPTGQEGSVTLHQDAELSATILNAGEALEFKAPNQRQLWFQIATGTVEINGQLLEEGDALSMSGEEQTLTLKGLENNSQVLMFSLRPISG